MKTHLIPYLRPLAPAARLLAAVALLAPAAARAQDLYVTNGRGTTVGEYNANTGATINASLVTGLTNPTSIAFNVPEPSTWALALGGLLALLGLRRAHRRTA